MVAFIWFFPWIHAICFIWFSFQKCTVFISFYFITFNKYIHIFRFQRTFTHTYRRYNVCTGAFISYCWYVLSSFHFFALSCCRCVALVFSFKLFFSQKNIFCIFHMICKDIFCCAMIFRVKKVWDIQKKLSQPRPKNCLAIWIQIKLRRILLPKKTEKEMIASV